jgi:lysine 2,3-aminomutase
MDKIVYIGHSTVQHGKGSNRIYVMSLDERDLPGITQNLDELARQNKYTKIIIKARASYKDWFILNGYAIEAVIEGFYNGEEAGYFFSKYLDKNRTIDLALNIRTNILEMTKHLSSTPYTDSKIKNFICKEADKKAIPQMVTLYKNVFKTYPFPIHQEEYIQKTMDENLIYFGIWDKDKLIALSSIELSEKYSNAEMTDFAVLSEYRGHSLARYLLIQMEKRLKKLNIKTAYTIARSTSEGMNITFAKNGYTYCGTLINNTDIAGRIESMNVWYKPM